MRAKAASAVSRTFVPPRSSRSRFATSCSSSSACRPSPSRRCVSRGSSTSSSASFFRAARPGGERAQRHDGDLPAGELRRLRCPRVGDVFARRRARDRTRAGLDDGASRDAFGAGAPPRRAHPDRRSLRHRGDDRALCSRRGVRRRAAAHRVVGSASPRRRTLRRCLSAPSGSRSGSCSVPTRRPA